MKKRIITLAALLVLLPVLLSADFSYRLDLCNFDPLYAEYHADRDRAGLDFQWLYVDNYPEGVYQAVNNTGEDYTGPNKGYVGPMYFPFSPVNQVRGATDGFDELPWMALIHLGETVSLMRNTFTFDHWLSPIAFDFSLQGSLVLGMEGGMADMIGYDGVFFYGATASIADRVSMRFGLHHYCTHYGDGTIKLLALDRNPDIAASSDFHLFKKYIRMDALAFGLSVKPIDWMRLYAEVNWCTPTTTEYIDTAFFAPGWFTDAHVYGMDDSYDSLIVNFGIELSYPFFPKLGKTTLSYDCHAYEEGQIVYRVEDMEKYPEALAAGYHAVYDPSLPWEFEHEVVISQEINDLISFELGYHHGRFPLNSMYHVRCNYGYIGARLNFNGGITAVDTAK